MVPHTIIGNIGVGPILMFILVEDQRRWRGQYEYIVVLVSHTDIWDIFW